MRVVDCKDNRARQVHSTVNELPWNQGQDLSFLLSRTGDLIRKRPAWAQMQHWVVRTRSDHVRVNLASLSRASDHARHPAHQSLASCSIWPVISAIRPRTR